MGIDDRISILLEDFHKLALFCIKRTPDNLILWKKSHYLHNHIGRSVAFIIVSIAIQNSPAHTNCLFIHFLPKVGNILSLLIAQSSIVFIAVINKLLSEPPSDTRTRCSRTTTLDHRRTSNRIDCADNKIQCRTYRLSEGQLLLWSLQ